MLNTGSPKYHWNNLLSRKNQLSLLPTTVRENSILTESNRVLGEEGKDWGIETLKSVLSEVEDLIRVG